jgi:pimeloyl-ACP methyl ester carboxylesterase
MIHLHRAYIHRPHQVIISCIVSCAGRRRAKDHFLSHRGRRCNLRRRLRRRRPSRGARPWRPFQQRKLGKASSHVSIRRVRVLALDFRGYGKSRGPGQSDPVDAPLHLDVLAAVRYLRSTGAKTVAVIGASMGAGAAGDASIASQPGEIDRLVFLGGAPNGPAEKLKSPTLFIVARNDTSGDGPRLPGIQQQYEKAPQPKSLIILEGSAHAQYLFQTDQAGRVMREILHFLSAK